jgi:regulator of cell morphogenesis and NO signaling
MPCASLRHEYHRATHHAYAWKELNRLASLTLKVATVHGQGDTRLIDLHRTFSRFAQAFAIHMRKEEEILFPMIRALDTGPSATSVATTTTTDTAATVAARPCGSMENPIRQMLTEHDEAGSDLKRIRELTDDFTPPVHACSTYHAMLEALRQFEADTHLHVHKENNVLFRRTLGL